MLPDLGAGAFLLMYFLPAGYACGLCAKKGLERKAKLVCCPIAGRR
jgi:hypothetical protein